MVGLSSLKRPKVALTIYVSQETKRGLKIAAALDGVTTSMIVEACCLAYLEQLPAVQKALREGG